MIILSQRQFYYSLLTYFLIHLSLTKLAGQHNIAFLLYDIETNSAVESANIFQVNTTYGSYSDSKGEVQFSSPVKEELLISHVAYEAKLLGYESYSLLSLKDTVWLQPFPVVIDELVVQSTRGSKWKKRYKKFKKGFLGTDKNAKKVTILNPEVLRFEEDNGVLYVTAVDLLNIDNKHLGYSIQYWLNYYKEESHGSTEYIGKAKFTSYPEGNFEKKRNKGYESSSKHFFKNLIIDNLEAAGYEASLHKRLDEEPIQYESPPLNKLIQPIENGLYKFYFPGFLKVVNHNITKTKEIFKGVKISTLEAQKFGDSSAPSKSEKQEPVISFIYKLSPYLLLNASGNILNTKEVKEYGYWAEQRIADQLPFEYGDEFADQIQTTRTEIKEDEQTRTNYDIFNALLYSGNTSTRLDNLNILSQNWNNNLAAPLIDLLRMSTDTILNTEVIQVLKSKTKQDYNNYYSWLQWLWSVEPQYGTDYPELKALLHEQVDPHFKTYFKGRSDLATIRFDEIVWGGVEQDGIPPLRYPKMKSAADASYIEDTHIVFGIYINGIARAYPQRILAWHEFFVDDFNDSPIAGVYCTLCGTMIAYNMEEHELGTSGFLYRSNKLMYDKRTQSLWSTIEGKPVVGPLIDKGIELLTYPVVTTTWGEWEKQHPETEVLSLSTGYDRNYDEGEAYKNYYATDELMFPVPLMDQRLPNKAEVLIIRSPDYRSDPTAISIEYLEKHPLLQLSINNKSIVVIRESEGIIKAYEAGIHKFKSYKKGILKDKEGQTWQLKESKLLSSTGIELKRVTSHNIFWFAWVNQYPETKLIK